MFLRVPHTLIMIVFRFQAHFLQHWINFAQLNSKWFVCIVAIVTDLYANWSVNSTLKKKYIAQFENEKQIKMPFEITASNIINRMNLTMGQKQHNDQIKSTHLALSHYNIKYITRKWKWVGMMILNWDSCVH